MSVILKCPNGHNLSMDHEVAAQCSTCGKWVTNVTWFHPEEVVIENGYVFRLKSEWGKIPLSHPVFDEDRDWLVKECPCHLE